MKIEDEKTGGNGGGSKASSPLKDIAAGTVAGLAQVAVGHPLDTMKVRMVLMPPPTPKFMDMARDILAKEGIVGLYAGVASPALGAMAHKASVFLSYGIAKQVIGGNREMKLPQYYAAGSIAAIVISMVESPVDLFKIKLQMKNSPYKGLADCAQKIFGGYGIVGVYQGFGATLMRNIPCFGAYFFTFETITLALTKKGEKPSLPICFVAGASAGAAYWGPFYPLEAIKSRMQADHVDPAKRMYSGIINCAKTMAAEGWGAFYRGLTPSLVRGIPVNGAIFTGFTATQRALNS